VNETSGRSTNKSLHLRDNEIRGLLMQCKFREDASLGDPVEKSGSYSSVVSPQLESAVGVRFVVAGVRVWNNVCLCVFVVAAVSCEQQEIT